MSEDLYAISAAKLAPALIHPPRCLYLPTTRNSNGSATSETIGMADWPLISTVLFAISDPTRRHRRMASVFPLQKWMRIPNIAYTACAMVAMRATSPTIMFAGATNGRAASSQYAGRGLPPIKGKSSSTSGSEPQRSAIQQYSSGQQDLPPPTSDANHHRSPRPPVQSPIHSVVSSDGALRRVHHTL